MEQADSLRTIPSVRPVCRTGVSAFPLDDELVLYEPNAGATYVLNPTATFIWSLCDGDRTLQEVADELADTYGVDDRQALTDVSSLVDDLERAGFLGTTT